MEILQRISQKECRKRRKKLLAAGLLVIISATPAFAFLGGLSFDPVAKAQRAVMLVKQTLQEMRTVQMIQEMMATYKLTKQIVDQSKAGIARISNPKTWEALALFAKSQFEDLAEGDPHNTKLANTIRYLDRALDTYVDGLLEVNYLASSLRWMDDNVMKHTGGGAVMGALSGMEQSAKGLAESARLKQEIKRQVSDLTKKGSELRVELTKAEQEQEKLEKKTEELIKSKKGAWECMEQASGELKSATNSGDAKSAASAKAKYDHCKSIYDSMLKMEESLSVKKGELENKLKVLYGEFQKASKEISGIGSFLAAAENMSKSFFDSVALVSKAKFVKWIKYTETFFALLLGVPLLLAILWFAFKSARGDPVEEGGHLISGFVIAWFFIAPFSPFSISKLAPLIAQISDTITITFGKPLGNPITNIVKVWQEASKDTSGSAKETSEGKSLYVRIMEGIGKGTAVAFDVLKDGFMLVIGIAINAIGALAIYITMILRIIIFWVLMIIAPMAIILAPLPWGRKVIQGWGKTVFGVVILGPIVLIMMAITNEMILDMQAGSIYGQAFSAILSLITGLFNGLVMLLATISSIVIAFKFTDGSFDGIASGIASGAKMAAVGTGAAVTAGAGFALGAAGGISSMAGSASSWAGAKFGAGAGGAGFTTAGGSKFGNFLSKAGAGMSAAGSMLSKTGMSVRQGGIKTMDSMVRRSIGLPEKQKAPTSPLPPEKSPKVEGIQPPSDDNGSKRTPFYEGFFRKRKK